MKGEPKDERGTGDGGMKRRRRNARLDNMLTQQVIGTPTTVNQLVSLEYLNSCIEILKLILPFSIVLQIQFLHYRDPIIEFQYLFISYPQISEGSPDRGNEPVIHQRRNLTTLAPWTKPAPTATPGSLQVSHFFQIIISYLIFFLWLYHRERRPSEIS